MLREKRLLVMPCLHSKQSPQIRKMGSLESKYPPGWAPEPEIKGGKSIKGGKNKKMREKLKLRDIGLHTTFPLALNRGSQITAHAFFTTTEH